MGLEKVLSRPLKIYNSDSHSRGTFVGGACPAYAWVVGFLHVYVGVVPRTARNFRRVQGNAPYLSIFVYQVCCWMCCCMLVGTAS